MSKKQAKPKKSFKLSDQKQVDLIDSSLRKYSDIIDQTVKLTNVEVSEQKNAKDRLRKLMINRVMRDYLSHTQNTYLLSSKEKLAIPGDIVVSRVGSYCIGKVGIVEKGYFVPTDCIFLIRIKDEVLRNKVFYQLKSDIGQSWIRANSKGVSALRSNLIHLSFR